MYCFFFLFFFFQAEVCIRDLVRSRGLGDVYKRQVAVLIMQTFIVTIRLMLILKKHLAPYHKKKRMAIGKKPNGMVQPVFLTKETLLGFGW